MSAVPQSPGFRKWSPISGAYFDPSDLAVIARAKSILFSEFGDVSLTAEQARDVRDWYRPDGWSDWKPPIYRLNRPQH